jgi:phenylacetic acid degradation operon negative regulatory protein
MMSPMGGAKGGARGRLEQLLATRPPRAKSLVVTVFGDSILPHGGTVWVGSLIFLLGPFGVNERSVRTALQRLTVEGWLSNESVGRRSDYSPTPESQGRFEEADRRIYAAAAPPWDGTWCLVLLGQAGISTSERDTARRELRWHGFGEIWPTLLLHPSADPGSLQRVLDDLALTGRAMVLEGAAGAAFSPESPTGSQTLQDLVRSAWRLEELALEYRDFLDRFGPLDGLNNGPLRQDPETCFGLRTLAIHEYRRILLRDPELPDELLPEKWEGRAARELCARLYRRLEARAEEHLHATCETSSGPLPAASRSYRDRFGGLREASLRRAG